jgi:hypothetical protein
MDPYKLQQMILMNSMNVVGDAMALHERLTKIVNSESYIKMVQLAEKNGISCPSMTLEYEDLSKSIEKFNKLLEKAKEVS